MNDINWFSMILSSLTPLLVGLAFYRTGVFGKAWSDPIGIADNAPKRVNTIVLGGLTIAFSFLLSFFLLDFCNGGINQEGEFDNFGHGAWHGAFLAVTVATPVTIANGFFGKKTWKQILINISCWIITLALMGGILDSMHHWENLIIPEG